MKEISTGHFYGRLNNKISQLPINGLIELTYRCNLNCVHCYCKGSEDEDRELDTQQWKKFFAEIYQEGCLWLCLSGGEPLLRDDFLELYAYAKRLGFIITIFTNGQALRGKILEYLAKSPPYSIEITLNGITQVTYEAITQVRGSFSRILENIKKIKRKNLSLILKSNFLKQNKLEIVRIKKFTEQLLGRPAKNKHHFRYDPMVFPRLNGDKTPTNLRLSFAEILELRKEDPDIWQEYRRSLEADFPNLERDKKFLYHCSSWLTHFFINPYGRLESCGFSSKFSADLKTTTFEEGFYKVFPRILKEQFKTDSKCQDCHLRPICYHCPARAFLETGDEEAPVSHYCELAEATAKEMGKMSNCKVAYAQKTEF
ncbi:MAG: radical SAM protein [Candidatus Omnitrophota bacterium]